MAKSSQAFRTIREVADWLDVAAHVLRFWESKFPQIKPVKRAGGRRYYRPADMELVGGIKVLLHDRGLTIRGVQKMIREDGVAAVAALSPPIDVPDDEVIEGEAAIEIEIDAWTADAIAEEEAATDLPQTRFAFDVEDAEVAEGATESEAEVAAEPEPIAAAPVPSTPEAVPQDDRAPIDRLAARLRDPGALPSATLARLRPALAALRDRMRADPAA
jgi:DNA-binding transcriptional MerR regulator